MKIELSPWVISETTTSISAASVSSAGTGSTRLERELKKLRFDWNTNIIEDEQQLNNVTIDSHPKTTVLTKKNRRRTRSLDSTSRDDATAPSTSNHKGPQPTGTTVVASFLEGDSSSSAQWEPLLSLTFAHQVTLLGTVTTATSSIDTDRVHEKKNISPLQQYLTRSTAADSFLSSSNACIPCVYDAKRQRLYACRDGNSRLVSWRADATPDEADEEVKLSSPAVSLAIDAETDVIYGSAQDGSLFVGRLITDSERTRNSPWTINSIENHPRIPDGARHVATFCANQQQQSQQQKKRKKNRKQQPASWRTNTTTLFQIHAVASHLLVHRHVFDAKQQQHRAENAMDDSSTTAQCTRIPLEVSASSNVYWIGGPCTNHRPLHSEENEGKDTENDDDDEVVAVICYYKVSDNENTQELVCATVSLSQGHVISTFRVPPPPISPSPPQRVMGLVGDGTLLGVVEVPNRCSSSSNSRRHACLCLYDVHRGGLLSRQPLEDAFDDDGQQLVSLVTNGQERLALVAMVMKKKHGDSESDGQQVCCCRVAVTSLKLQQQQKQQPLTLAQGLMLSASSARNADVTTIAAVACAGAVSLPGSEEERQDSDKSRHADLVIGQAIRLLREARDEIQRSSMDSMSSFSLSNAYVDATRVLTTLVHRGGGSNSSTNNSRHNPVVLDHANNPQEPSEKMNGCHVGKKRKATTTHSKSSSSSPASKDLVPSNGPQQQPTPTAALEPRMLPQAFVASATIIAIEILLLPDLVDERIRNEARALLRRLVRTGKVSARQALSNHRLSSLLSALEPTTATATFTKGSLVDNSSSKTAYSPVDFIFDLYRYCNDVSEHQMMTTIHYMLSRASSSDMYSHLCRHYHGKKGKQQRGGHQHESVSPITSLLDQWDRLQELRQQHGRSSEQQEQELAGVACKLGLVGTTALVQKIALYSECNESLLKNAVWTVFKNPTELALLCRLFSDCLRTCGGGGGGASLLSNDDGSPSAFAAARLRLMQWLTVVCEGLGVGVSSQVLMSQGLAADIAYAQETVVAEVKKTECMLPLKGLVDSTVAWMQKEAAVAAAEKKSGTAAKKEVPSAGVPLYQIERLVF